MKKYAEKQAQLEAFVTSLRQAIAAGDVQVNNEINLEPLEVCLAKAESLSANGFDWDSLKALAQSFAPVIWVIWVHKESVPPLVRNVDGTFAEPEWFARMSEAHGRAERLALERVRLAATPCAPRGKTGTCRPKGALLRRI